MRAKGALRVEVFWAVAFSILVVVQTRAGEPGEIEAHIEDLEAVVSDLQAKVNSQQSAITTLQSDLAVAQAAIAAPQTALNAETTARQAADSQLQDNLAAESQARQGGDAQLQGKIDNLQAQVAGLQMSRAVGVLRANPAFIVSLAIFIVASMSLIVASMSLYRAVAKPRVKVYFWDQVTNRLHKKIAVTPGDKTFRFVFRNYGDILRLWKPAATQLTVFVYLPEEFQIKAARRFETPEVSLRQDEIYSASPSGIFAGRKYFAVPSVYQIRPPAISIVSYREDVICEADITIPGSSRKWEIYFQMSSREGGLRVRKLSINVQSPPSTS